MNTAILSELIVNGETVPHSVVAVEAQNHDAPAGKPAIAWRKAANAVAVRTLLLQEARRRELQARPVEVGPGRFETDEEALIRGLLETAIDVKAPSVDVLHAEWSRDPSRFRSPPLWEVSHILCACDPRDETARNQAEARAVALTERVLSNPGRFARLAAEHSDCGSKVSRGALGQLAPGDTVPEFEAALRKLAGGDVSAEPVLSRYGWHIIRMDAVAVGAILPFDAVRQKISDAMEKAYWTRSAREFINELIESSDISGADIGWV